MKKFEYQEEFDKWFTKALNEFKTTYLIHYNSSMHIPAVLVYLYDGLLQVMSFKSNRKKSMYYFYELIKSIKTEGLKM